MNNLTGFLLMIIIGCVIVVGLEKKDDRWVSSAHGMEGGK